jgi:phosphatidate cytidylyltransferase
LINLKRGFSKALLRKVLWTIIVILFVFVFSFIQIYNLYKAVYWVVFPLLCVPVNGLFASIIGVTFGKTPLNKNLPDKTLEGYLGGLLLTGLWAFFVIFADVIKYRSLGTYPSSSIWFVHNIN